MATVPASITAPSPHRGPNSALTPVHHCWADSSLCPKLKRLSARGYTHLRVLRAFFEACEEIYAKRPCPVRIGRHVRSHTPRMPRLGLNLEVDIDCDERRRRHAPRTPDGLRVHRHAKHGHFPDQHRPRPRHRARRSGGERPAPLTCDR